MIYLLLAMGIGATACSIVMIKFSTLPPLWLTSMRLLVASVALTPLFLREARKVSKSKVWQWIKKATLPGIILSVHFMTWIYSARLIPAANSTLIVNMVPLAMPLVIYILYKQKLTQTEFIGTLWALGGVFILIGNDFNLSTEYLQGDSVSLVSMIFFTFYLALANKFGRNVPLWGYLVPLYTIAGLIAMAVALVLGLPLNLAEDQNWLHALLLGLIPTVIGHSIINFAMTRLRPQIVSLANLGQVIFAGIYGLMFFQEIPQWNLYIASIMILGAAVYVIRPRKA